MIFEEIKIQKNSQEQRIFHKSQEGGLSTQSTSRRQARMRAKYGKTKAAVEA